MASLFALVLVGAVLAVAAPGTDLPEQVRAALPATGVESPVTGVLLAFRAYDTLLEVAVLLVAVVGASLAAAPSPGADPLPGVPATPGAASGADDPVLGALVRLLVPLLVLLAVWLLWAGKSLNGGAFQAGAVLASAGVLLRLHGMQARPAWLQGPLRLGLLVGLATFLGVGALVMPAGHPWLAYPPGQGATLIMLVETVLTVSIGASLYALFLAGHRR
jgi:multisubunit Na+/H+ antiporter MnhB subunit